MSSLPAPRYSLWQAVSAALALALRAIEEVRALSREPGPQGEPGARGERGVDGLGFDDLTEEYEDDGRVLVRRYSRDGVVVKEFRHASVAMIYRGVHKDGAAYQRGDTVTWAGSLWHCNGPTMAKPIDGDKTWTLATKRGRDGKDGTPGKNGGLGPKGEKGDPGPRGYGG